MKIIIKGHSRFRIDPNLHSYINEKIGRLDKFVLEPAICEVTLHQKAGPKRGLDKDVHIAITMPGLSKSIFAQARTNDFMGSIDIAFKKIESEVQHYKEKKANSRFPKKYYEAKLEEEKENEI